MSSRKPSVERRQEIALAALAIIGERGLTALTTAALAEHVGVSTGALFRHFASLEEVQREMVRHGVEALEDTFPERSRPPRERLMELARRRVELLRSDAGLSWLLGSEQVYLTFPPEAVASLRAVVRKSRRYLLEALREGRAEGSVRDDIEPEAILVPILGTIHALSGMPGVHRPASARRAGPHESVLGALERMISPPSAGAARIGGPAPARKGRRP